MVPLVLIPNGENTIGPPLTLETPAINVVGVNTTEPDVSSVTLMVTRRCASVHGGHPCKHELAVQFSDSLAQLLLIIPT